MDFRGLLNQATTMQGPDSLAQYGLDPSKFDPSHFYMYAPATQVQSADAGMQNVGSGPNMVYDSPTQLAGGNHAGQVYMLDDPTTGRPQLARMAQSDNWQQGLAMAALAALTMGIALPGVAGAGALIGEGGMGAGALGGIGGAGVGTGLGAGLGAIDGAGGMSLAEGAYPASLGGASSLGSAAPALEGAGAAGGAAGSLAPSSAAMADPALGSAGGMVGPASSASSFSSALGSGGGSGISSLASSLGMDPNLLQGGMMLGGALMGSQPTKSTVNRDIPAWLKPYAMQQLNYGSGLLNQQMSPQYMQAANDMRSGAMGLLAPQQSQNFARFFPGH